MNRLEQQCKYCLGDMDQPFSLQCKHTFCYTCLLDYLNNKIKCQQISYKDLVCPFDRCQTYLTADDAIKLVGKEKYEKIQETLFQQNEIQLLIDDEVLISCPSCKQKFVVSKFACIEKFIDYTLAYFTCSCCKKKHCLECRIEYHEGLTCQEAQKNTFLLQATEEQQQLYAYGKENGMKICPVCHNLIQKADACNFIRCGSKECKNQTYLCYLCGEKLNENDHFDHYEKSNPFNNKCRVKNSKGQWVDQDYPEYLQEQSELNKVPCPKCSCLRKDTCEIIPNFNYKICYCKSEECKGSYYCLQCSKKLKPDDSHFINQEVCQMKNCLIY